MNLNRTMVACALSVIVIAAIALPAFAQTPARPAYDPAMEPTAQDIFQELLSPY